MGTPNGQPQVKVNESSLSQKIGTILVGFDSTEILERLIDENPVEPGGFSMPIVVIDPSGAESSEDDSRWGTRVRVIRGVNGNACLDQFRAMLLDEIHELIPGQLVCSDPFYKPLANQVESMVTSVVKVLEKRVPQTRARIDARTAMRGENYLQERYAAIQGGEPARIILSTSRFTTFVQHSVADLAEAFENQGHEVEILIETNNHTGLSPIRVLETIELQLRGRQTF